ncbi:MAG: glycosyltransferase family 4 protein [Verrucomicrobiae bacterium]|nr:glycosyltransferase family 4 protein [Verrucomicrobiae bacterium]
MKKLLTYSIAMPLNRGGMSTIAWQACRALHAAGGLKAVFAPETGAAGELAAVARSLPWPGRKGLRAMNRLGCFGWHDALFDAWVASRMSPGDWFFGWLDQSLACIRKSHAGGGRAGVDRGSVEPRLQDRWLREEYAKYGLNMDPTPELCLKRMVAEADEADWIMAPSTFVADSYAEAGYDRARIRVNPLGVEAASVNQERDAREERDGVRFVFLGQLSLQKGMPALLKAWRRAGGDGKNAELILGGVIPEKEQGVIEPMLREARKVRWEGHCQDVFRLLRSCDVLILPSVQDGFGLVVLEAMAAGAPVIVSDRVGARDCVKEGVNGFVFPWQDAGALEERMRWFMTGEGRARNMRQAALATARENSWEAYGRRFVEFVDGWR